MAEFTYTDLRAVRESRKLPRWKLARELGVSEDTLERWETGKQRPEPDDVGHIERVLESPGIWHRWMMSHYDSYRERNSAVPETAHVAMALTRMRHEMGDVSRLIDDVERDALDGRIDDPDSARRLRKEALEAVASIQQVLDKLPDV